MVLFGINEQFPDVHIKYFGYFCKCFQIWLNGIGTPLGDRCGVFPKLLSEPFSLLVGLGKHSLDSIEFNDFHFQ